MQTIKFLSLLFLLIHLTACGQTGPLYLPDEAPPIHVEPEVENEPEEND